MSLFHSFPVWLDMRTSETVDCLLSKARNHDPEYLKPLCGLPISTYFSAVKLRWLLDNVKEVQDAVSDGRCLFGTIDSWIIWVSPKAVFKFYQCVEFFCPLMCYVYHV